MRQPQRNFTARESEAGYGPLGPAADWVGDVSRPHGLGFYLDLVRSRLWLVVLIVAVTVNTAVFLVARTDKVYEAHADLLVTPVSGNNEDFIGLGLVTESGDPTRDAETMAKVITSSSVAERARTTLRVQRSPSALRRDVTAEPVAQSSIVSVTARASDPDQAARLANAFAESAVVVRTQLLRRLLDFRIPRLRQQLAELPPTESREELSRRIRALESLRLIGDPTLHLEARATPSSSPVAPRPFLTIAAGLIAGLVLAFGVVFGAHFVAPRIEREEDLWIYRVPVVGRIPKEGLWRFRNRAPLGPGELSPAARDAFHRLARSLAARVEEGDRAIFVTSPGPNDGKTTTSVNLAVELAASGDGVVLADADSRRPTLATTVGLNPTHGLAEVASGEVSLDEALVDVERLEGRLRVLGQEMDDSAPIPITADGAADLVRDATKGGSWLIVDGAALGYAPDLLPLAKQVPNLLVVVHLRRTRVRDLEDLAELLTQQGLVPDGFIVIGGKPRIVYR